MCEIAPPREGTSPTHPPGRHAVSQLGNLKVIKWQNIFYCQRARKLAFERHFWLRDARRREWNFEARRFGAASARALRIKSFGRRATDCGDRLSPYLLLLCCFIKKRVLSARRIAFFLCVIIPTCGAAHAPPFVQRLFGCIIALALSISYAVLTLDCKFET